LEHLFAVGAKSPWLGKGWYVSIIRLFAFLFRVRDEARGMGKASQVTTTRAISPTYHDMSSRVTAASPYHHLPLQDKSSTLHRRGLPPWCWVGFERL
jgi:hypothetical protein